LFPTSRSPGLLSSKSNREGLNTGFPRTHILLLFEQLLERTKELKIRTGTKCLGNKLVFNLEVLLTKVAHSGISALYGMNCPMSQMLQSEGDATIKENEHLLCARHTVLALGTWQWMEFWVSFVLELRVPCGRQRVSTQSKWVIVGWDKSLKETGRGWWQRIRWGLVWTGSSKRPCQGGGNGTDYNYKSWLWNPWAGTQPWKSLSVNMYWSRCGDMGREKNHMGVGGRPMARTQEAGLLV
jgi:hypothetical protein